MEQDAAPPQPPPLSAATATTATTTTIAVHPDSVDPPPLFRNNDSKGEDNYLYLYNNGSTTAAPPPPSGLTKLRLMCSYGGHIVPRPHDKSLCYVGGDTRIVVVDRHITLPDLTNRLAKTLIRSSTASFTLKYQLPTEDLDSLISVTTGEDLENMIDEYDRLNSNSSSDGSKSSRLRLFLFPTKPESVSSIGSLLERTVKSEDWFLSALNGATSGVSDTSSVNCLLGLEEDVSISEKKDVNNKSLIGKKLRGDNSAQDIQSVPDSPMMETSSSFGSGSSLPSLANLPPIRVIADEQHKVGGAIEEQFPQMSVQQQHIKHQEDVNFMAAPAPVVITGVPLSSKVAIAEIPNRVLSEDERLEQGFQIAYRKQQQQQQQQQYQQKQSMGFDMTSPDSVSSDGSVTNPLSRRTPPMIYPNPVAQTQFSNGNNRPIDPTNIHDQSPRIQMQPQHQPQFIYTATPPPQYLHHHPSGAVPVPSYYPMYHMPARQPPPQGYNSPMQADTSSPAVSGPNSSQVPPPSSLLTATKTEPPPAGVYRTANSGAPVSQLIQIPSSQHQIQPQYVGYSHIHHPSQTVAYEFADSSQKGQHIYYAGQLLQPMNPTLPVESGSHIQPDSSLKQQVRTSQL